MSAFLLNRPGITVFGIKIYFYAIFIVTGMVVAMVIVSALMKKFGINTLDKKDKNYENPVFTYALAMLPAGVLGARLYPYLFPYKDETVDWSTFFNFRNGGLGIYGGIILGLVAMVIVALIKKHNIFKVADCCAPAVMIAQAIGRWGNCVNQEAYGLPVTNPDLQWFPFAVYIENPTASEIEGGLPGWYNATFFYESLWNVIGFTLLMILIYKYKWYRKGFFVSSYFLWYGLGRLWVEGLRTDPLYFEFFGLQTGIRVSQLVSVIGIIAGLIGYAIIFRKELKRFFRKKQPAAALPGGGQTEETVIREGSEDVQTDAGTDAEALLTGEDHSGGGGTGQTAASPEEGDGKAAASADDCSGGGQTEETVIREGSEDVQTDAGTDAEALLTGEDHSGGGGTGQTAASPEEGDGKAAAPEEKAGEQVGRGQLQDTAEDNESVEKEAEVVSRKDR